MSIMNSIKPAMFLFALFLVAALPVTSSAQGRGKGNGAGSNIDKKCAKFVNCHDARDGRWDGRGPAVNRGVNPVIGSVGIPTYPDIYRNRRNRNRQDDNSIDPSVRNRRTDRDRNSSGDSTWRRRRTNSDGTDTWRRRRTSIDGTETRNRRVHRRDRTTD